ncbi:hypothetical protein FC70_GL001542 [Paucilactobacillus oligofermentans DSM 15707 = LMG 22743]|uniref:Insertion element IS150 protein InsJ-like helix-turn-helix domain-containing protein n=1 Tax=Paucilactobacillus oligofermentans DSM 15707 = LMG 22743 TaxID=1423778 RepID=A0A0R1RD56_9LACO|nr:helix-turn-helix domain-containing protein [Paucilactobacillus oligofermentans]KRL54742.1 hypothetical protein FC70_GL001542 [Paucilactobacillus oligofermentans DSM 15707 = LMG 22743]CUS26346.1 Transposase [Paucilactobacillus oligofermentans DSM 15707 = LMG 22743]
MRRKKTLEERIKIVEYVTVSKHKYSEAAEHFEVTYQQVLLWVLKAKENGYEALVDNRGHRKPEKELSELDKDNLKIKQLETELEEKNAMEAFIKKFQELQRKGLKNKEDKTLIKNLMSDGQTRCGYPTQPR